MTRASDLHVLDPQRQMLDDLRMRAARAGVGSIVRIQADAQALPYASETFDALYMIGVLGEVPNQAAALRELNRVLRRGGRLVVGEVVVDPDYVGARALEDTALEAGFVLERTVGPPFSYFAVFRREVDLRDAIRLA